MFCSFRKSCAILALAVSLFHPQISFANPGDGVVIADVAAMEPHEALKYIHHEASMRGLQIGAAKGNDVLECLSHEFIEIKQNDDDEVVIPRGIKAIIQLVHRHNNNGGSELLASDQIREIVDLVAQQACGVSTISADQ